MEARECIGRALEIVFPPRCIFCGIFPEQGQKYYICKSCYGKIPFCTGGPFRTENCGDGGCDSAVSVCRYTGMVKDSLIKFKFYNKPGYYRTFAALLQERLAEAHGPYGFDLITSVPLHRERQRTRGYNQAALLAGELSRKIGVPYCRQLLKRIRKTEVQSLLPGNERELNVRGAFEAAASSKVCGKSVLLVDDVLTTGSTVDECSRALKKAGAVRVTAAVIATGRKY